MLKRLATNSERTLVVVVLPGELGESGEWPLGFFRDGLLAGANADAGDMPNL